MTLPTISPVILFAVVLGVIQGLQYFTQAYVAASVASGQASQAADVTASSLGYPLDSTLFYPVLLYQHGFTRLSDGLRVGDGDAPARRLVRGDARDRRQLAPVGALRRGRRVEVSAAGVSVPFVRRRLPASVRRRRFLLAVANHSLLIAASIAFLAPFVFIALTALMTNDQALSARLWPHPFAWHNFIDVFTTAPMLALDAQHARVLGARDARVCSSRASLSRTRSRACAGAAATSCS